MLNKDARMPGQNDLETCTLNKDARITVRLDPDTYARYKFSSQAPVERPQMP